MGSGKQAFVVQELEQPAVALVNALDLIFFVFFGFAQQALAVMAAFFLAISYGGLFLDGGKP